MKNKFLLLSLLGIFFLASCEKETGMNGKINLSLTDAPVDADGIKSVFITVTEIQYHTVGDEWKTFNFDGPKTFDLLELQRGNSEMMGSFELEAGSYTQLRFMVDAPVLNGDPQSNPGCYLEFEDGTTKSLFVPGGAQTGYKAIGEFTVPANGTVNVTADFDARKSVVEAGASGKYLLKPTIRLVVDNQAGQVAGEISGVQDGREVVIYAYEKDTWEAAEANEPAAEQTRFPNAITSDKADENNRFLLAFLAPGIYDLIVAETVEGEFTNVLKVVEDIEVVSSETTTVDIGLEEM